MKKMNSILIIVLLMLLSTSFTFGQLSSPIDLETVVTFLHNGKPKVLLTWEDTNITPVRFSVYRKEGAINDSGVYKKVLFGTTLKSYTDLKVSLNKTYSYYVVAYKGQSLSDPSAPIEVTIVPPPPPEMATITGIITDDVTGNPLNKAYVNLFNGTLHSGWQISYTDSLGQFKYKVPVGEYYLYTSKYGYYFEYYNNVQTYQSATPIVLSANDSLHFNISLAQIIPPAQYTLSGTVKDSLDNPIKSKVRVYKLRLNSHFSMVKEVKTDSMGNYTINVKENDTVIVFAQPINTLDWYSEFWDNKSVMAEADKIPVTENITDINFVLQHKPIYTNGISGIVKDTLNVGVESVVNIFPKHIQIHPMITPHGFRCYTTATDTLGNYQITNLFPNNYILLALPKQGYKPSYFTYSGIPTLNWRLADSVVIGESGIVENINITVNKLPDSGFAAVNGIVRDVNGNPINGTFVYAVNNQNEVYGYAISDINGHYTLSGLVPDEYIFVADKNGYNLPSNQTAQINYSNQTTLNFTLEPEGVTQINGSDIVISDYALFQNYPNPFNPTTTISFQLPEAGKVALKVYNILGKEVATLINGNKDAGKHSITFDASALSSGVYFYKLEANNFVSTKKLILMK